jgi:hypothetical protein
LPVAVDVGLQAVQPADQRAGRVGVEGIEFLDLSIEQVIEEKRGWFATPLYAAAGVGIGAGDEGPSDFLGVAQYAGLYGFVFAGLGHDSVSRACDLQFLRILV